MRLAFILAISLIANFPITLQSQIAALDQDSCAGLHLEKNFSLQTMISEYARLKKKDLQHDKCSAVYKKGRRELMYALGDSLSPGMPENKVTYFFGKPDEIKKIIPRELVFVRRKIIAASGMSRRLYIYTQSPHDYLYFVISRGEVVYKNWYHTSE